MSKREAKTKPLTEEEIEKASTKRLVVPFDSVVIDKEFNSRKDYKGIGELAVDIRANGLISSPVVMRDPKDKDRLLLTIGFRRMLAILHLRELAKKAKEPLPFENIEVKLFEGDDLQRYIVNMVENVQRTDLHVWEIGDQCVKIRDRFQLSGQEISEKLRWKKSHINNCMRVVERIVPEVQKAFREGRAEPPFSLLITLATLSQPNGEPDSEKQKEQWEFWLTGGKKRERSGKTNGKKEGAAAEPEEPTTTEAGRMRRLRDAERVLAAFEKSLKMHTREVDREFCRGGIAATKYLMGQSTKIRKLALTPQKNDPKKEPKK